MAIAGAIAGIYNADVTKKKLVLSNFGAVFMFSIVDAVRDTFLCTLNFGYLKKKSTQVTARLILHRQTLKMYR